MASKREPIEGKGTTFPNNKKAGPSSPDWYGEFMYRGINMLIKGSDGNHYIRARGFAGLSYEVKQGTFVGVDLHMQGLDNGEIASTILAGVRTTF